VLAAWGSTGRQRTCSIRPAAYRRRVAAHANWNIHQFRPGKGSSGVQDTSSGFVGKGGSSSSSSGSSSSAEKREEEEKERVAQQLDPLTSVDEAERRSHKGSSLLPDDEAETVEVLHGMKYESPTRNRGRPGNAFLLAWSNFVDECKVRSARCSPMLCAALVGRIGLLRRASRSHISNSGHRQTCSVHTHAARTAVALLQAPASQQTAR
jgi:hypothetical protein